MYALDLMQSQFHFMIMWSSFLFQVTNVPDEDGGSLTVTYLRQPFKTKTSIWAWGESREDFVIDRHHIERVLSEPEIITTRTGAIYFHFPDLD